MAGIVRHNWLWWLLVATLVLAVPISPRTAAATTRHIRITAADYAFSPGKIRVNPGDRVTLEMDALDVVHGLYLDGYGLSVLAEPGQPARLSFVADRTGTFALRCSVTCGPLHPFMLGRLQVGPNLLLWRGLILAVAAALMGLAGKAGGRGRLL